MRVPEPRLPNTDLAKWIISYVEECTGRAPRRRARDKAWLDSQNREPRSRKSPEKQAAYQGTRGGVGRAGL